MANMAVEPESWLRMYPEFQLPAEQKKAWLADRTGAIVGIDTARKFGWKVGDHVPLISPIYRKPDGSPWDFTIDGIYDSAKKGVDKTQFFFHYDYMNETLRAAKVGFADIIGWYVFKVEDPATADQLAKRVDAMFENSSAETKTATEKAFTAEWAKQVGDIGSIMIAITAVGDGIHPVRRRQRHGAVDPRAHQRARRAENARVPGRQDPGDRAARVVRGRHDRRQHRPGARLDDHRAGRSDRRACCRSSISRHEIWCSAPCWSSRSVWPLA